MHEKLMIINHRKKVAFLNYLKLGQKSLIGVEKSDFSKLQDPSGNPVYQQGVTSVCVTSRGFLEAEPVIAGAGGGGTLPHRGSFAPPSGFCSFVPSPPSTSSFSPPSSLLLFFELCSVTPHLSKLQEHRTATKYSSKL